MSKGRILVVEDNMDNYELVRFILERAGYDVFLAMNGRDGVAAARLQQPGPRHSQGERPAPGTRRGRARLPRARRPNVRSEERRVGKEC